MKIEWQKIGDAIAMISNQILMLLISIDLNAMQFCDAQSFHACILQLYALLRYVVLMICYENLM